MSELDNRKLERNPCSGYENDMLPWPEKYRPQSLEQVVGQETVILTIKNLIDSGNPPHLLFHGPSGTGKTSTIHAIARKLYAQQNEAQMVMELNAGDDRELETIQSQVKRFASTRQIFNTNFSDTIAKPSSQLKLIILDEADTMGYAAQMALRRIMEDYASNVRFCIIVNHIQRLSPAIVSRCTKFRFRPLSPSVIKTQLLKVIEEENIDAEPEAVESLARLSKGDMSQALSTLQKCSLRGPEFRNSKMSSSASNEIDSISIDTVYDLVAAPRPSDIDHIIKTLLDPEEFSTCIAALNGVKSNGGIDLADIVAALAEQLQQRSVPGKVKIVWLEGLAEIEWYLRGGASEDIQMGAVVGVIRRGSLLMDRDV